MASGVVAGRGARRSIVALAMWLAAAPAWAADLRGWDWLADKLVADGVPRAEVVATFSDPRMPEFDGLEFGLYPRESHAMYRGHLSAASIARARRCRDAHAAALEAAEARTGVSADVVAAIISVESACGQNTGSRPVLPGLARLAMANEPDNLERNLARHTAGLSGEARDAAAARTRERARYLEDTFYPEVRATFIVAERVGADPLGLRGSGSGAFGIPQFLPGSYLRHGVDGDGDGRVSLYDHADAIHSCAAYLKAHGWRPDLTRSEQRQVIWAYNRSDAYIDTVLAVAARLGGPVDDAPVQTARAHTTRRAVRTARKTAVRSATAKASAKQPAAKATKASTKTAATKKPAAKPVPTKPAPKRG